MKSESQAHKETTDVQADMNVKSLTLLQKASQIYNSSSPGVAKFLMSEVFARQSRPEFRQKILTDTVQTCPYCGLIYHPDNHKTNFLPRMKKSKKIQKIQKKQEAGHELSSYQRRILLLYNQSKTRKVTTCNSCSKKTVTKCCFKPEKAPPNIEPKPKVSGDEKWSKAKTKRMKKKRAQAKAEASMSLDQSMLSEISQSSADPFPRPATSTPKGQDSHPGRQYESGQSERSLLSNSYTKFSPHQAKAWSTPKSESSHIHSESRSSGSQMSTPSFQSMSDILIKNVSESAGKKGKRKNSGKHGASSLQKMLKDNEKKKQNSSGSSLMSFLSSI